MNDIWIVFAIIAAIIALFMWDRLPVIAVCVGAALSLWATGVLTLNQRLAGFGDPAVIFIAALFVVSAGLEMTGVTAWAGQVLIRRAGDSRTRLIVLMMGFVAVLTRADQRQRRGGGASAGRRRHGGPAEAVAFATADAAGLRGACGLLLVLTGSPVNVLVVEASMDAGGGGFGYFEFALVGVPIVLGSVAIVVLFGERLLPSAPARPCRPT